MVGVAAAATKAAEGRMFWLWYPRGDTVVFGVWPSKEAAYDGGRPWSKDIPGWIVPMSPPEVELVFPLPGCAPALGILLDRDNDPELRATLNFLLTRVARRNLR